MSRLVAEKLALVTGAGSGIGREVCRVLAREGATVVATDVNLKTAEETAANLQGSGHLALQVDVSNPKDVQGIFQKIKEHFTKVPTVVVNSAGIVRDNFILNLTPAEFDEVINVNLKGTFLIVQSAAQAMIEAGVTQNSSIVNIGSIVGKIGNMGQCQYGASKAGVEILTKTASMEFGKLGIRVNTVVPGFIRTPMTASVPENVMQMLLKRIPLYRMGEPAEVAEVVAFLASDKSSYINGASIDVNGGLK